MDLLDFHELLDNAGAKGTQLLIEEGAEDTFLEIFENAQPFLIILDEISSFGDGGVEDLEVGLRKLSYVVLLYVLGEDLSDAQRVPDQGSTCQLIVEGICTVDYWTKFDNMGIEDITANLSSNMQ